MGTPLLPSCLGVLGPREPDAGPAPALTFMQVKCQCGLETSPAVVVALWQIFLQLFPKASTSMGRLSTEIVLELRNFSGQILSEKTNAVGLFDSGSVLRVLLSSLGAIPTSA